MCSRHRSLADGEATVPSRLDGTVAARLRYRLDGMVASAYLNGFFIGYPSLVNSICTDNSNVLATLYPSLVTMSDTALIYR